MKKVISRHAENDFHAYLMADAMESVGAEVFSVTYNGVSIPNPLAMGSSVYSKFIVWAKFESDGPPETDRVVIDTIDEAIVRRLDPKAKCDNDDS